MVLLVGLPDRPSPSSAIERRGAEEGKSTPMVLKLLAATGVGEDEESSAGLNNLKRSSSLLGS
jgi:hypothetical protein